VLVSPAVFRAAPQGSNSEYHLIRNVLLGGTGGWDYVSVDPDAKRVYLPRSADIMITDEVTGKLIADVPGFKGIHGVALAPEFGVGFVGGNDTDAVLYVLDLKALKMAGQIPVPGAKDADSVGYDPASKRAFINTAATHNVQAIDAATRKLVGSVMLPGNPEAMVPDGKGSMFVQISDKSSITEYDTKTLTVKNTWSIPTCVRGVGLSMDPAHRRLFLGCQNANNDTKPGRLIVVDADNGKVVATMPNAIGCDGVAFDPVLGNVVATNRDIGDGKHGVTYVWHEDSPDKYTRVGEVQTIYGARTIGLDPKTHHIFSASTEQNDPVAPTAANPTPRPRPVPSTFMLVEIGK
jgi:DNA-binding beta-propeller fold protein YncE